MSSNSKRRDADFMKLLMEDYKVGMVDDSVDYFYVFLNGPADSPYAGGVWKVRVELTENYPYSSPSIIFVNTIFHPNIDEPSGTVCLDVLDQNWTPFYDLVTVFEIFLPQLLLEPNPDDPLNEDAAALLLSDKETYEARVKEYCERYAKPEDVDADEDEEPSDEEASEDSGDEAAAAVAGLTI